MRWGFPLYLLLINLFVLPIALAGLPASGPGHDADIFVLDLPMTQRSWLAVLAFIGGLSAATGMVTSRPWHWRRWCATTL